jgi:hypothetical protein
MIEDVNFLLENSEQESIVIYIDSTLRNRNFYADANQFTIQFDQPFKNVFGFEILDGSIPNTMYNIDKHNNLLCLTSVNSKTIYTNIQTSQTFINMFNSSIENYIYIANTTPLTSFITPSPTPTPYAFFTRNIMNNVTFTLWNKQTSDEYYIFSFNGQKYIVPNTDTNTSLITILSNNEYYIDLVNNRLYYYDINYYTLVDFLSIPLNTIIGSIGNFRITLTPGNYDGTSLLTELIAKTSTNYTDILGNPIPITFQNYSNPVEKRGQLRMLATDNNFIIINAKYSTIDEQLGFDANPKDKQENYNYQALTIGDNSKVFGSIQDPTYSDPTAYQIVPPGLINLFGERFAILRIEELEDHIFGSYSYMAYTPGIGMFKLASNLGTVTNLRFDYTSLIRKPFHPIGKLDKITFRFETARGNLYDFKGVSYQLLFMIKFLVPSMKNSKFTKSVLNPNYDPNIMNYLSENKTIEYKENSDDEEEFDEDDYYLTYKKELDQFDYSTSEDEEDTDTEDSEAYISESEEDA